MLKYTVKPSKDTELRDFPIRELFVSPDLSYISGTTDINVGLVNGEQILIKSPYLIGSEVNTINVQTVKRQGNVLVSIDLPVEKITTTLNFPIYSDGNDNSNSYILAFNDKVLVDASGDTVVSSITQNYVEYNGDICYLFQGSTSGYLINHKFYEANVSDESVTIDALLYIEDGKLIVGDYIYYADFSKGEPELRLSKEHQPIESEDIIGLIDGNKCKFKEVVDYEPTKWNRVSKFYIEKEENPQLNLDDVLYGGYKHYVTLDNENYYLKNTEITNKEDNSKITLYGVTINNIFYNVIPNYDNIEYELYDTHHDLLYAGTYVYIGKYDEYVEVKDKLISPSSGGRFVIMVGADGGCDVMPGNYIIAESNSAVELRRTIQTDDEDNEYIEFQGKKYCVEPKICDTVNVSGEDYQLTYLKDDYSSASTVINGDTMYFNVSGTEAWLSHKVYYKDESSLTPIMVKYGINENHYEITENSGVTVNGIKYPVIDEYEIDTDEISAATKYVLISENIRITLEVTEKNGLNTYLAYPVIDDDTIDATIEDEIQREYCDIIVKNWKTFNFSVRKDTFGNKPLTVENGLMKSMVSKFPYTLHNDYLLENKIEILRMQNYLSFNFPLPFKTANNLRREEIIKNEFVDYIKSESINTIVDMEKDVYYPVWKDGNEYKPIQQLRFNLHFRTRNFDNWKIYEDDREFKGVDTANSIKSNWFVTDLKYYKNILNGSENEKEHLHNSSDLLGFLNFTTDEIKNQSTKIGKSFLRLSFYSTNDPNTQVLLATSTIFLDENFAYKKYINSKRNADLTFVDVKLNEQGVTPSSSNTISDSSEVYSDYFFNDDTRLSSRIVVNDKYNTNTSSEGYYIYMFKDYAKKMREETIYMKVEFNHAGIGKTMTFMLPREIGEDDVDGVGSPLYIHKNKNVGDLPSDLDKMKNGVKLTDIYKQTHIPIKVIFDDKSNRYVYYLPKKLRENDELGVENEIMEFNLFEIKFANESIV
jgi:hypothetical protein